MVSVVMEEGSDRLELEVRGAVLHLNSVEAKRVVMFLAHALSKMPEAPVQQMRERLENTYLGRMA